MRQRGANVGATQVNDFLRQADGYGQADRDLASSRTDPDGAERLTGIYGSAPDTAGAAPYRHVNATSATAASAASIYGSEGREHVRGSVGGLPRTRRWSVHDSRNLRAPAASLRDRLRRPVTEPVCRQVRQLSGSGEGPGPGRGAAGLPEAGREMAARTRASRCHQPRATARHAAAPLVRDEETAIRGARRHGVRSACDSERPTTVTHG
jgi:hypothetical protein